MKVKIHDTESISLIPENDAEKAILSRFEDKYLVSVSGVSRVSGETGMYFELQTMKEIIRISQI